MRNQELGHAQRGAEIVRLSAGDLSTNKCRFAQDGRADENDQHQARGGQVPESWEPSVRSGVSHLESLELDLWQLAIGRRGLEELELVVTHLVGDDARWYGRDRGVEIAHDGVVVAPRVLDGFFYCRELSL